MGLRKCVILSLIIFEMATVTLTACKKETEEAPKEQVVLEDGTEAQWKYENAVFTYQIMGTGARILDVELESGTELKFPDKIGDHEVHHLYLQEGLSRIDGLEKVVLPKGLTIISEYWFKDCKTLKHIEIQDKVEAIAEGAFSGCEKLEELTIPESVKEIPKEMCKDCVSLKKVVLAQSIKSIGDSSFENCSSLVDIDLSELQDIGDYAFKNCTSIETINLNKMVSLGTDAFRGCTALCQDINASIGEIEAFADCMGLDGKNFYYNNGEGDDDKNFFEHTNGRGSYLHYFWMNEESLKEKIGYTPNIILDGENMLDWEFGKKVWESGTVLRMPSIESDENYEQIYRYFNGKTLAKGESISVGELKELLFDLEPDSVIWQHNYDADEGFYLYGVYNELSKVLSGVEIPYVMAGEYGDDMCFTELEDDYQFTNTQEDITFYAEVSCYGTYGEDYIVILWYVR